ncbi:hypothetical protein [Leifsonia sp. Root4]|uniref:hypothetical protein n=1 Tax=Leifsonia sp. Root4 TaxID=1736525 RepID=UPI000AC8F704|nr:hypothetical protein [Leifsonia sp. Root4]
MTNTARPKGASLKRMLAGKAPVFIVQRGAQFQDRLPEVFDSLAETNGRKLGLGTVARMQSRMTPARTLDYLDRLDNVPLKLVDPEFHRRPESGWEGAAPANPAKSANPWAIYDDIPKKPDRAWVGRSIQAQYQFGATVALSASGWVDTTKANVSLANAMAFVAESRAVLGHHPMFVNLTMDYRWLVDKELRGMLLQEITESSEKLWYLRFWWPIVTYRYGQLLDEDVLRGYRILTRTAAVEGKQLILPNSGLTGWVMSALGAAGFSTGTSWPDQAFARQRPMGGRKGQKPPPHTPRFFDRHILHTLDYTMEQRLAVIDGHKPFETPFSRAIAEDEHNKELAGLHYLTSVGNLQANLSSSNPTITATKALRQAERFLAGVDDLDQPTGGNSPLHLGGWGRLLN